MSTCLDQSDHAAQSPFLVSLTQRRSCGPCVQGNTDYQVVASDFGEHFRSKHSHLNADRLSVDEMKRCLESVDPMPRHYLERSDVVDAFRATFTPADDALFDVIWYDTCVPYGDAMQKQLLEARRFVRSGGLLAITVSKRREGRESVHEMCDAHFEQLLGVFTYSGGENDKGAPMAFCYGFPKPVR